MATSVQGWKKKWFYIKDQKVSSSDQYGIAPFDASKEVQKLTSWDSPPTEAEMEEIKPLLARIQALKSGKRRCAFGHSTYGIFPATSSSTPSTSSFQTVVLFWLGRFFSSI
jgi:hypothetical protein